MPRLKSIFVEYNDVLPFPKVKETEDAEHACLPLGRMEELARDLDDID
jgi:hypothetical protein